MATDTTLVQGAYDANKYRGQAVDAAQRRLGDNLNKKVGELADRGRAEKEAEAKAAEALEEKSPEEVAREDMNIATDDSADEVLDKDGGIENEDYSTVKDVVSDEWRLEYINGDEGVKTAMMANLKETTGQMATLVEARKSLATEWGDRNVKGGSSGQGISASVGGDDEEWVNQFLSKEKPTIITRKTKDKNGKSKTEFGVEDKNGEFITMKQADKYISSLNVDVESFNSLTTVTEQSVGLVDSQSEDIGFDRETVTQNVKSVIKNGNPRSLMYDNNFSDTSFIEDLEDGGFNIKYTDLGLTPPAGDEDGEFNPQDNLSEEDKKSVIDAFIANETLSIPMLENYFVQHTETRWNKAYKQKYNKDWGVPVSGSGLITPGGNDSTPPPSDDSGEIMIG